MKKLEPGCLAIVLNAGVKENIGKVVTVVDRDGAGWWKVEGDFVTVLGTIGIGAAKEEWLLRIDGGEDETITHSADDEVTA